MVKLAVKCAQLNVKEDEQEQLILALARTGERK
jgi:hypothetical protein